MPVYRKEEREQEGVGRDRGEKKNKKRHQPAMVVGLRRTYSQFWNI